MKESVNSFRKAISQRPDLSPVLVELGETYFQMGKLDKALSVLESALSLDPNQAAALYLVGRCQLELGNAAEALKQLTRAERLNSRLDSLHYHLGMAYGRLNQLGEAHYHFGLYYLGRGSLRNSSFHFQEALRRTDDPAKREAIRKRLAMVNKKAAAEAEKEEEESKSQKR